MQDSFVENTVLWGASGRDDGSSESGGLGAGGRGQR